ncbi:membrane hypothetical protein [uncultured Desulfobacterium sp.]|uniref:Uncharacterized protein n=1 Tax=uncultured Desulfobacterium sp. TaxID=201089 RepID=A0A445N2R6_9BACT|nr:membrane hypothetical protein [uncultured Desulfobacterium sp.]
MKYFYGKFMSLFPLGIGIAIVFLGMESPPVIKLSPDLEVSREVFIGIGGAFIGLAFFMVILARYVELAVIRLINIILPESLRIDLEPPAPEEPQIQESLPEERMILKEGRSFEMDSNYVLTSHFFTIKQGLLVGVPCLMLATGYLLGGLMVEQFPDLGILPFVLFPVGIAFCSKRTDIQIDAHAGLLTERRKIIAMSQVRDRRLDKFDRVIVKKRLWFGLSSPVQSYGPSNTGFGVIYLVQLGGTGLKTINFYRKHEDARELALALADATRLPLLEIP